MLGNPPFLGGRNTTVVMGSDYQRWLAQEYEPSPRSADLCAFFFRRAFTLLRAGGTIGFIATKTIAQGTTREAGLKWICDQGGVIYSAVRRQRWPGRGTAVRISVVHVIKKNTYSPRTLDSVPVNTINSRLQNNTSEEEISKLPGNKSLCFQGSITLGMGFTFDDRSSKGHPLSLMDKIIEKNPSSHDRIWPYLGGSELNTHPTHSHHRYVINFETMNLADAERWPELLALVKQSVYPHRVNHRNPQIRRYPWWQHWNPRVALYQRIKTAPRVLLTNAQAAAHLCFSFYEGRAVFANSINVFNLNDWGAFAILQSRIHEVWAWSLTTTLGDQIRYNPTTCFETFPFPEEDRRRILDQVGERYHTYRSQLMHDEEIRHLGMNSLPVEGLTNTYNRFHQPECDLSGIIKLRELHAEMDQAVAALYGWSDLKLVYGWVDHYTHRQISDLVKTQRSGQQEVKTRYTFVPEVKEEVLLRLKRLNQEST